MRDHAHLYTASSETLVIYIYYIPLNNERSHLCPCVKCTVCVKPRGTNEGVFFILHLAVRGTTVESSLRKVTVWIIVLHGGNRNRTKSCKKKKQHLLCAIHPLV